MNRVIFTSLMALAVYSTHLNASANDHQTGRDRIMNGKSAEDRAEKHQMVMSELKEKMPEMRKRMERTVGHPQIVEGMGKVDPNAKEKELQKLGEDTQKQWELRRMKQGKPPLTTSDGNQDISKEERDRRAAEVKELHHKAFSEFLAKRSPNQ